MPKATVTLKHLHHRDEHQIGIYFSYDASLIEAAKAARLNNGILPPVCKIYSTKACQK